jgi:uncharacterized protein YfdQ (DUF2303 family)
MNNAVTGVRQPNIIETALEAGKELTPRVVENPITDGVPFVILRDDKGKETAQFLRERFDEPARKIAGVKLNDAQSFIDYWKRHADKDSTIYGVMQPAQFLAVFDDHGKDTAAYREHRAIYRLGMAPEWDTWTAQNGKPFDGNEKLAIWLENQVPDIVSPDGAKMLEIALNFRINSNAAFGNNVRLQDGRAEFTYTNQVEASSTAASGKVTIPESFSIVIPVFAGLNAQKYTMEARFRYRLGGSRLSLWYELVRPHKIVETAFKDVLEIIEKEAATKVLFGWPE